ncbi:GDSL-type esterase/lipase family protein [Streptomyces sp. NPDC002490]|uniref:GDSL-type esterase/lipase family protein n=1 Tax=Streptomyces sp. NPDC002490 TaxID=3154416 RepID=UPI0033323AB4
MTERPPSATARAPRPRRGALPAAALGLVLLVGTGVWVGASPGADEAPAGPPRALAGPRTTTVPAERGTDADSAALGRWVTTWAAAPVGPEPRATAPDGEVTDRTVRNVVHTSVGGTGARVTLSHRYGTAPLHLAHATLALAAGPGSPSAVPGTVRRLTFAGRTGVRVPPGGQVVSDPVALPVPADTDLLITTYAPASGGPATYHPRARQTSYLARGDHAAAVGGAAYTERTPGWRQVVALDVRGGGARGTLVAFGDSLTDGVSATPGANRRWPDVLADRLRTQGGAPRYGVANLGISGNRLLTGGPGRPAANPSGLRRFPADVLDRSGVRVVVIALGINDILRTPHTTDPTRITEGLRTLTRHAHAHGLRVVGATLMPFHGHRGHRPELEEVRRAVNAGIRAGGVFDAVADFDRAVRDPYHPEALHPHYDSGDHLHPNDAGYHRMAEAVDLGALRAAAPARL